MSWWRRIAIEQLDIDPNSTGSWPKVIAKTIGATQAFGHSWPEKIAHHLGLPPNDSYEQLGQSIFESSVFSGGGSYRATAVHCEGVTVDFTGPGDNLIISIFGFLPEHGWHHNLVQVINGVPTFVIDGVPTALSDLVNLMPDQLAVLNAMGEGLSDFTGDVSNYWIGDATLPLDENGFLTTEAIAKFIDADGYPVDLGEQGELPTGTQALVCLTGDAASFVVNRGSLETTVTGTITDSDLVPRVGGGITIDLHSGGHSGVFDVSGNAVVQSIDIHDNAYTSADVSGCTALTTLDLTTNSLTALDVSGCTALTSIALDGNSLTSFDGTGLASLTYLDFDYNALTAFDGTGLTSLTSLVGDNNALTSVDVSALTSLTLLSLGSNALTTVDISGLTVLTELDLTNNALDQSSVDDILAALDANGLSNGTVNLSGGPNAPPSDPAGFTSKANLEGKGWTVVVQEQLTLSGDRLTLSGDNLTLGVYPVG
jgi:Leucine-rich repeat (LRR) protein